MRMRAIAALLAISLGSPVARSIGQEASGEESKIRANLKAYLEAYAKRDASALADLWSEEGEFQSPLSGNKVVGRAAIEKEYRDIFAGAEQIALEAEIQSLRLVTPEVAVEDGVARVMRPGDAPEETSYRVIHVRQDGKWLIDSVRETAVPLAEAEQAVPGQLAELAWVIGDWVDSGEGSEIYLSASWVMGNKFIRRNFDVVIGDQVAMNGIEVIGWDPREEIVRSWVFDSEGGFGSAEWEKGEGKWVKRVSGTTADGRKVNAVHVVSEISEDGYQWQAHSRSAGGELLPNIDAVTVRRLAE